MTTVARLEEIERGRGDRATDRIMGSWSDYRGKAIEPLVRKAIERLLPLEALGDSFNGHTGGQVGMMIFSATLVVSFRSAG